jgi:hypothetical protein
LDLFSGTGNPIPDQFNSASHVTSYRSAIMHYYEEQGIVPDLETQKIFSKFSSGIMNWVDFYFFE